MPRYWTSPLAPWVLALLSISGCASQPSMRTEPSQDSVDVSGGVDFGSRVTVYPGALDFMNRYISNVIVLVGSGDSPPGCSGVLMASDKALTAAHCVCTLKQVTDSEVDRFASGSTRFATAAQEPGGRELSRNYEGDSGGGGFSQENDTVLVGIISARVDRQGAVFESVYPHVKWLSIFQN